MAITAQQVKELRDATGISMIECKKALEEAQGDMEVAHEVLRKRGLAKAAKAADRQTSEGAIRIEVEGTKAYVVSAQCETDFVANTPDFQSMLADFVKILKTENQEESARAKMDEAKAEYVLKMGENINIKDVKIISGEKIGYYLHSNAKIAAVIVANTASVDDEKLKQVAMHATATNPDYLSPSEISEEVLAKEKAIQLDIMKNDPKFTGKPDQVLEQIIVGKMNKFKEEISLLEQAFVINPDIKVKDFVGENSLSAFYRFKI